MSIIGPDLKIIIMNSDVLDGVGEETDEEIEEELLNDDGICKPVRHFVFHKKHKCGSTAFRFIFQVRYPFNHFSR